MDMSMNPKTLFDGLNRILSISDSDQAEYPIDKPFKTTTM